MTSLGFGAAQINAGLERLFGWQVSTEHKLLLVAVIAGAAVLSVSSGLKRGIRCIVARQCLARRADTRGGAGVCADHPDRAKFLHQVGRLSGELAVADIRDGARPERLVVDLDDILLGLVDQLDAVRSIVHRPHLARPHGPRICSRRAPGPDRHQLRVAVDHGRRGDLRRRAGPEIIEIARAYSGAVALCDDRFPPIGPVGHGHCRGCHFAGGDLLCNQRRQRRPGGHGDAVGRSPRTAGARARAMGRGYRRRGGRATGGGRSRRAASRGHGCGAALRAGADRAHGRLHRRVA